MEQFYNPQDDRVVRNREFYETLNVQQSELMTWDASHILNSTEILISKQP